MDSFAKVFHQYYSPLCNYVASIIGDNDNAEDIVQDVFIKVHEKGLLDEIQNIEAFLLRSVKYKSIDYLRTQKTKEEKTGLIGRDQNRAEILDITEEDIEPLFHYYAAKLPPKTRAVFLMNRSGGLTYKEIAEKLDISSKTVEKQMTRALKKMRELLKEMHLLLF